MLYLSSVAAVLAYGPIVRSVVLFILLFIVIWASGTQTAGSKKTNVSHKKHRFISQKYHSGIRRLIIRNAWKRNSGLGGEKIWQSVSAG